MKRLKKAFMLAGILASLACTGTFAAESNEDAVKPVTEQVETKKAPRDKGGKARKHRSPSEQAARMQVRQEKEKIINEFMRSFRAAERTFNEDKRAASKLPPEERKAAKQKAVEEMQASIKKAEETRDAALDKIEPGRKQRKKKHPDKRKKEKDKKPVKADKAEPAKDQLKTPPKNAGEKK